MDLIGEWDLNLDDIYRDVGNFKNRGSFNHLPLLLPFLTFLFNLCILNKSEQGMYLFKQFILIIFLISISSFSFSQPLGMMERWRGKSPCLSLKELDLSWEQLRLLRSIQQEYFPELRHLRAQLLSKRMEFKEFLKNPNMNTESLRAKSDEIIELKLKLERKGLEYLFKIRNLFTQEQLEKWCPELDFPFFGEMMIPRRRQMHPNYIPDRE